MAEERRNNVQGWQMDEGGDFPDELLKPRTTFAGALVRANIPDQNLLNSIILYHRQLQMFNKNGKMQVAIDNLIHWLVGSMAVQGRASTEALEAHVGIFFPEATGFKASKDQREALAKMQKPFRDRNNRDNQDMDNPNVT